MISLLRTLLLCCICGLATAGQGDLAGPNLDSNSLSAAVAAAERVPMMGHPRLFKGQADFAGIVAAMSSERADGFKAMVSYLRRHSVRGADVPRPEKAMHGQTDELTRLDNWFRQERLLEGMAEAGLAWYVTRDAWHLEELQARIARFGPQVVDRRCEGDLMQARAYAWYFALAYDFAFQALSSSERILVKNVVRSCADASLVKSAELIRASPQNGVAFQALGKFVGTMLIMLGDMPEAHGWLVPALQTYVANLSPWGGDDGGYANGTSYALWDIGESLLVWDLIDRVLEVPIYRKPWVAAVPKFVAYTLPPGTPAGVFGDGAEVNRKEEWARFGKSIMNRYTTPLARWYVKQLFGEDPARLHILLSPREFSGEARWPANEENSAVFNSVGWAALHSHMADRSSVSVYFKSSPFGSLNHSHADQNSFVIYAHGRVLAMDSGHYDFYNSPHWRDWYKHTRAHNAITFDGGQGQSLGLGGWGTKSAGGKIIKFESGDDYDLVTGDAMDAYAGQLSAAKRTLIFFKPATVVVIDQLASSKPRKWEWNLHTGASLTANNGGHQLRLDGAEMCVYVASPAPLGQETVSGYVPKAQVKESVSHYWNKFIYTAPQRTGMIISVLRMDCSLPGPQVSFLGMDTNIAMDSRVISVSADDVRVQ